MMIAIDYEEFEPETYRAVRLIEGTFQKVFASGDVTQDFNAALEWAGQFRRAPDGVVYGSSVDSFLNDHNGEYQYDEDLRVVRREAVAV